MVQSSSSSHGQLAAAIRKADPRTRAAANPAAAQTQIEHGHEGQPAEQATWPERLAPAMPRSADGSERQD